MTQNLTLTRAERLEEFKSHARARADELIAARERYKDYLSRLPAAIYNNNLDIYTAALNRMDAEIDSAIEMAEEEEKAFRLYLEVVEARQKKDGWKEWAMSTHADWLDEIRTKEDAHY